MAVGKGKYDDACTVARESTKAIGVALLVFGGEHGDGFSVQAPIELTRVLPSVLREMADQIGQSLPPPFQPTKES